MSQYRFGSLTPIDIYDLISSPKSKIAWMCDCGKTTYVKISRVKSGNTRSCGKCSLISVEDMASRTFGSLRMKNPIPIKSGCHDKHLWVCTCGREKMIDAYTVINGLTNSCGRCNEISKETIASTKYGRLRMKEPIAIMPRSTIKRIWICDCGQETKPFAHKVISGHTSSCGKCWVNIKRNFESNKEELRKLKYPIEPHQIPGKFIRALETINRPRVPFRAVCPICNNEYKPNWERIRAGVGLTCGCSTNRVSSGQKEISDELISRGMDVVFEHDVSGFKYDIFIKSRNLLIEFNGLKWHSFPDSKERDMRKYKNAVSSGYSYFSVFEDEWNSSKQKILELLEIKLKLNNRIEVYSSDCEIVKITKSAINNFYEKYHVHGSVKAPVNYGVFNQNMMIGAISFKKFGGKIKNRWELIRVASVREYELNHIWNKVLEIFIDEHHPHSIYGVSDNRMPNENFYESLGFKLDFSIKPSFLWWKNKRRINNSESRKIRTQDESESLENLGYKKVWDVGKKRFILLR